MSAEDQWEYEDEREPAAEYFKNSVTKDSLGFDPQALSERLRAEAMLRAVDEEDFYHMLSRYPTLEIIDANAGDSEYVEKIDIGQADSGWVVHDCGNYIVTSPGRLLYGSYRQGDDDEAGGGIGTLQAQSIDTAWELIAMAKQRWQAVYVLSGYRGMQRAAWIAAQTLGIDMWGFEPNEYDELVLQRVREHELDKRFVERLRRIKGLTLV